MLCSSEAFAIQSGRTFKALCGFARPTLHRGHHGQVLWLLWTGGQNQSAMRRDDETGTGPGTYTENTLDTTWNCPLVTLWDLQASISNNIHGINVMTIIYNYFRLYSAELLINHTYLPLLLFKDWHGGLLIDSMLTIFSCPKHPTSQACPDSPPLFSGFSLSFACLWQFCVLWPPTSSRTGLDWI